MSLSYKHRQKTIMTLVLTWDNVTNRITDAVTSMCTCKRELKELFALITTLPSVI